MFTSPSHPVFHTIFGLMLVVPAGMTVFERALLRFLQADRGFDILTSRHGPRGGD